MAIVPDGETSAAASRHTLQLSSGSAKAATTILSRGIILLVGGVTSVVISRSLGPAARGEYYVVITLANTAMSLAHLSLEQSFLVLWVSGERKDALGTNAVMVGVINGVFAAALAFVIVALTKGPTLTPGGYPVLLTALIAVPIGLVVMYLGFLLMLDDKINRFSAGKLVAGLIQCGLLLALAFSGHLSASIVVFIWVLATAIPLVVFIPAFRLDRSSMSLSVIRRAVGLGFRYHVGMTAMFLLWRADVFMLNERVSRSQVGLYSLAVTLAELTYLATDSVSQALLPRQVDPSLEEAGRFTARLARTNLIVAILIIGAMSVFAPVGLTRVYGDAYRGTTSALVVLGPGIVMLCLARTLLPYLVRLERPWAVSALTVSALALNIALNLALIPRMGIVGSSLASSVAYGVLSAIAVAWWCRSAQLGLRELIPRISDVRDPLERMRMIRG